MNSLGAGPFLHLLRDPLQDPTHGVKLERNLEQHYPLEVSVMEEMFPISLMSHKIPHAAGSHRPGQHTRAGRECREDVVQCPLPQWSSWQSAEIR